MKVLTEALLPSLPEKVSLSEKGLAPTRKP